MLKTEIYGMRKSIKSMFVTRAVHWVEDFLSHSFHFICLLYFYLSSTHMSCLMEMEKMLIFKKKNLNSVNITSIRPASDLFILP